MSARNGDKSRHHRVRKQKLAKRLRDRVLRKEIAAAPKSAQ
jgi:hypothetical protein